MNDHLIFEISVGLGPYAGAKPGKATAAIAKFVKKNKGKNTI